MRFVNDHYLILEMDIQCFSSVLLQEKVIRQSDKLEVSHEDIEL